MRKLLILLGMVGLLTGSGIGTAGATGFTLPDDWDFASSFRRHDGFHHFVFDLPDLHPPGDDDGIPRFPFDITPRFFDLPQLGKLNLAWIDLHHWKKLGRFRNHHTAVPEPSTAVLLALGLVGLATVHRRASQSAFSARR